MSSSSSSSSRFSSSERIVSSIITSIISWSPSPSMSGIKSKSSPPNIIGLLIFYLVTESIEAINTDGTKLSNSFVLRIDIHVSGNSGYSHGDSLFPDDFKK